MTGLKLNEARQMVERLKLFAQPQRLVILDVLLQHGPLAVGELENRTGIGQPTLSQQLGKLRRAEIVVPRRESRAIFYSIASDDDVLRVRALIALLRADEASLSVLEAVTTRYGSGARDASRNEAEGGAQFASLRTADTPRG